MINLSAEQLVLLYATCFPLHPPLPSLSFLLPHALTSDTSVVFSSRANVLCGEGVQCGEMEVGVRCGEMEVGVRCGRGGAGVRC